MQPIVYESIKTGHEIALAFSAYSGGIFTNTATSCGSTPCYYTPVDHAISLVGWDDNPPEGGGGCWILRNSWGGSWGENGYMRIRYEAARVACEVCYLTYLGTNTHVLTITSPYGQCYPPAGAMTNNHNASMTCYITNTIITSGTTQFGCAGWTGSGSVPATGTRTNTGNFSLTNDSAINWLWRTNFYLRITTNGAGSVNVASDWQGRGSNLVITATPASSWDFTGWSGDTGGCSSAGNTISFLMDGARAITASFSSNSLASFSSGVCADYDGDRKADPALYDGTTGTWRVKLSSAGYYLIVTTLNGLGGPGLASVSADYDGDRKADPAVYAEESGGWTILKSSLDYAGWVFPQALGGAGYSGIPSDYDADAKADPGVYHRVNGNWLVLLSSANYASIECLGLLGGTGWRAVAADYDGDYKADPAVYGESNPSTGSTCSTSSGLASSPQAGFPLREDATEGQAGQAGVWVFRLSSIGYLEIVLAQALGGAGYLPVPADYDGDGLADPAVRSLTNDEWIVMFSSGGYVPTYLTIVFE